MTAASLTSKPDKLLPEGIALEDVTPTIAAAFADNPCLIYSGEHRLYWRANAHGYTSEATRAGRYTIGDAYERTRHCDPDKQIRFVRLSSPVSGTDMVMVPAGMKPWDGGERAPDDWDGGGVLLRNGSTMFPSRVSLVYHRNGTNRWDHQRENRKPEWDIVAYTPASASPSTPIPVIAEAGERDAIRLAYKTGHAEGYIDATDDGTGKGYCDHDAAEEGWQQYQEKLGAEAVHSDTPFLADIGGDLFRAGRSADAARPRGAAAALIERLVRPMVQERSREKGDAWDQADAILAALSIPATLDNTAVEGQDDNTLSFLVEPEFLFSADDGDCACCGGPHCFTMRVRPIGHDGEPIIGRWDRSYDNAEDVISDFLWRKQDGRLVNRSDDDLVFHAGNRPGDTGYYTGSGNMFRITVSPATLTAKTEKAE